MGGDGRRFGVLARVVLVFCSGWGKSVVALGRRESAQTGKGEGKLSMCESERLSKSRSAVSMRGESERRVRSLWYCTALLQVTLVGAPWQPKGSSGEAASEIPSDSLHMPFNGCART